MTRPARITAALAAALAALAVAACGGDETTTVTDVASSSDDTVSSTTATTADEPPAQPSAIKRTGSVTSFQTPSENIGCAASKVSLRCDVTEHDWEAPPPAEPCSLDYGNGIAVGEQGVAQFTCAGDTVLDPSAPVLGYGDYVELYGYRCASAESGLTCEHEQTGNGFEVSRETVRAY